MRLPPWLIGLLIVLAVAVAWWTIVWDTAVENTDSAATPATVLTPTPDVARPTPTPAGPTPGPQDQGADEQDRAEPTGTDTRPWDRIDACEDDVLPATMIPVVEDIWAGGPYDHPDRDGTRFGNYEGYLPDEDLGYYREFTVQTPGLDHRGARRIVTGGGTQAEPEVWYYTEDHYESFCEFAP